jgi:hypothetical protein
MQLGLWLVRHDGLTSHDETGRNGVNGAMRSAMRRDSLGRHMSLAMGLMSFLQALRSVLLLA